MIDPPSQISLTSMISSDVSERLDWVVRLMRQISSQTDPQQMVDIYGRHMRQIVPSDASISLSRRDLAEPQVRITRFSGWDDAPNPWQSRHRLPVLDGGILGRLIWGDQPVVIDELDLADDDPAAQYIGKNRSLVAIPLFDQGKALNMVVLLRKRSSAFKGEFLPEHVWLSNLFGRATHNLVLSRERDAAYQAVDRELAVVADIQRSLLPVELPKIPTLDLASDYQTSRRAGGDYYDFFELPDGRWGILIADVSGHGTPAAVIMAVTHSIAHTLNDDPEPPSKLLNFINRHLTARYTNGTGTFVTAFYGIYDPRARTLVYANAGHNPPRHKRVASRKISALEGARNLPLGIDSDERYEDSTEVFAPGDAMIFYTDGITEARASDGTMFGPERLDQVLGCSGCDARDILRSVLDSVREFTNGASPTDDRTLLAAKVT